MTWAMIAAAWIACSSDGASRSTEESAEHGVAYLANMGVLLESGGQAVLIDALFGDGLGGYPAVPPAERARLEAGEGRYGEVDLVLVTHVHADHFDPHAVARYLDANPWAVLLAPRQAVDSLVAKAPEAYRRFESRVHGITPPPGEARSLEVNGVPVRALRLVHPPSRNEPVELVGWRVDLGGRRHLHVGDIGADVHGLDAFDLPGEEIDVALVPYWLVTGRDGRRLLDERVDAGRLVALHVPRGEVERIRRRVAEAGGEVVVHGDPAEMEP